MTRKQQAMKIINEAFTRLRREHPALTLDEICERINRECYPYGSRECHPYKAWRAAIREFRSAARKAYPSLA